MKLKSAIIGFIVFILAVVLCAMTLSDTWKKQIKKEYVYYFTNTEKQNNVMIQNYLDKGINSVQKFCGLEFKHSFDVYVHPDRKSLDKQWAADWRIDGFKSECWMVASGTGNKLDLLSPYTWDSLACEHQSSDFREIQLLITHELFHVLHGQYNPSEDFSVADTIDWFVEGFAVYGSGQLDSVRLKSVQNAIWFNQAPDQLADFWTGKLKYGFAGSMVKFIDTRYGRRKLIKLLSLTSKSAILKELAISENDLIEAWKKHITTEKK